MGDFVDDIIDPFDLVDTGGKVAPSNILGIGDNADDGIEAAAAAQQASADAQLQLGREQIEAFERAGERAEERLQPFTEFGEAQLPVVNRLLSDSGRFVSRAEELLDPQAQLSFLESNPLFQAAVDQSTRESTARAAAGGKAGSGDLVNELFNRYLATGETFIGNQIARIGAVDSLLSSDLNRLLQPVSVGQASAAGQAANIQGTASNVGGALAGQQAIHGNIGDINAAFQIQKGNINQQQQSNLQNMIFGGLAGSGMLGGAGIAGGGLLGGGLGALAFCDGRLKENKVHLFTTEDGIKIYSFNYVGEDEVRVGPMAEEVEEIRPDAVYVAAEGYKMVDLRAL